MLSTTALASVPLTERQARQAGRLALESSLSGLVYRSVGTAETHVRSCRVRGRRAVCYAVVRGTLTCRVRLRELLTGRVPATDPDSTIMVWADRIDCD